MKIFRYLPLAVVVFAACQSSPSESPEITEIKDSGDVIPYNILAGTDTFSFTENNDTNTFAYTELSIQTLPKSNQPGEQIWLLRNGERRELILSDAYFYGKTGNFLLFDIGTSPVRTFEIYKADNLSHVLTAEDYREPELRDNAIYFKTRVDIFDEAQKPACPEELKQLGEANLGFLQTRSFDLNTLQLHLSNQIECAYFE